MIRLGPDRPEEKADLAAAAFLGDVRAEFQALNQKLVGDIKRDPQRDDAIARCVRDYFCGQEAPEELIASSERLLHRFEVLCARVGRTLEKQEDRGPIYRVLLDQLTENVQRMGFKPGILVTATLLNNFPLFSLTDDAELSTLVQERRFLLHRALQSSPAHPREFLAEGIRRLGEIDGYLEKSGEVMHQHTRLKFAFMYRAQPTEELLRERKEAIRELLKEPEFRMLLTGREWLAAYAVDQFRDQMIRPRLRQIHLCVAKILANDQFAELRKRPGDIVIAAISHPKNTEKFLTEMLEREQRLRPLLRISEITMSEKELRALSLKTPKRARALERQLQQKESLPKDGDIPRSSTSRKCEN